MYGWDVILAIVGYVVLLSLYKITPYEYNNIIQVHCECANVTPEEASAVEDYQCSICKEKEKLEMMNDGIADTREYVVCVRGVRARRARISIILLSLVIYLANIRRNHKEYHVHHKQITRTPTLECTLEYLRKLNSCPALEHRYDARPKWSYRNVYPCPVSTQRLGRVRRHIGKHRVRVFPVSEVAKRK